MRIAFSNIAWDLVEDEAVKVLLARYQVNAIDIAPGKYFPDPAKGTPEAARSVVDDWAKHGIEITGMQSLLFGTAGLNVFGPADVQEAMLSRLGAVCRLAGWMGAPRLVFGSPRNRDRTGLSDEQAQRVAVDFFRRLGDLAAAHDVVICLEPNPEAYGCNFMTTGAETAAMVRLVNHGHVRMQLDTGAAAMTGESVRDLLSRHADLIGHVHLSEPELLPLGYGGCDHESSAAALLECFPDRIASIEMRATEREPHLAAMERALKVAIHHYRPNSGADVAA